MKFLAVAEAGKIGAAAERLAIAQPAPTRTVARLEVPRHPIAPAPVRPHMRFSVRRQIKWANRVGLVAEALALSD